MAENSAFLTLLRIQTKKIDNLHKPNFYLKLINNDGELLNKAVKFSMVFDIKNKTNSYCHSCVLSFQECYDVSFSSEKVELYNC